MGFEVIILGSSSATPIYNRHPTSQLLTIRERCFLIDCGEGTLMQLLRYRIKYHRISHIFISHLHGDHYLGLMGLLSTFHLQGRTTELHLYGQQELMDVLEMQLRLSNTQLRYNLIFHAVRHYTAEIILENEDLMVRSIVLNHRVPCTGFVFMEKSKPRKLIVTKLQQHNIPFAFYNKIKHGDNFEDDYGNIIPNKELTEDPPQPCSYAYCSDTIYDEGIINDVSGVDLLYHEATFLHENLDRAQQTYHTTSQQAATIASKAGVKKLIIGHFSGRYKDLTPLLNEAISVFPESDLALEGRKFKIG
ncbi:MAG: ribonuclease Z [Bacteroidota bacterium]